MPIPQKPQRQPDGLRGFLDRRDQERAARQDRFFRGLPRFGRMPPPLTRDDFATPEPEQELEDSYLSDAERRNAIARERMRRER